MTTTIRREKQRRRRKTKGGGGERGGRKQEKQSKTNKTDCQADKNTEIYWNTVFAFSTFLFFSISFTFFLSSSFFCFSLSFRLFIWMPAADSVSDFFSRPKSKKKERKEKRKNSIERKRETRKDWECKNAKSIFCLFKRGRTRSNTEESEDKQDSPKRTKPELREKREATLKPTARAIIETAAQRRATDTGAPPTSNARLTRPCPRSWPETPIPDHRNQSAANPISRDSILARAQSILKRARLEPIERGALNYKGPVNAA